jgi:ribosomal protein S3AE
MILQKKKRLRVILIASSIHLMNKYQSNYYQIRTNQTLSQKYQIISPEALATRVVASALASDLEVLMLASQLRDREIYAVIYDSQSDISGGCQVKHCMVSR